MNNRNKILVGCLALLLVLSVGYALFSETITINGTATAKGSFDITTTCSAGLDSIMGLTTENLSITAENGYENESCSVTDNKVSFVVDLKYPGAARYFTIKAKNTGTIPALVDFTQYDEGLTNIKNELCTADENGNEVSCSSGATDNGTSELYIHNLGVTNTDGEFILIVSDEIVDFTTDEGNMVIKPGETVYYVMGLTWKEDYTSTDNSANYIFKASAEIPLVQTTSN